MNRRSFLGLLAGLPLLRYARVHMAVAPVVTQAVTSPMGLWGTVDGGSYISTYHGITTSSLARHIRNAPTAETDAR